MNFNVKERFVLIELLPRETNFVTLKLMRVLKEELSFSEDELKKLEIHQNGNKLTWNFEVTITKDVEIGDFMKEVISKELKRLDKENKLTEDHFSLYEKFIE